MVRVDHHVDDQDPGSAPNAKDGAHEPAGVLGDPRAVGHERPPPARHHPVELVDGVTLVVRVGPEQVAVEGPAVRPGVQPRERRRVPGLDPAETDRGRHRRLGERRGRPEPHLAPSERRVPEAGHQRLLRGRIEAREGAADERQGTGQPPDLGEEIPIRADRRRRRGQVQELDRRAQRARLVPHRDSRRDPFMPYQPSEKGVRPKGRLQERGRPCGLLSRPVPGDDRRSNEVERGPPVVSERLQRDRHGAPNRPRG